MCMMNQPLQLLVRDMVVEGNGEGRAPSLDVRQEVDVNEVTINRKVIPIADSEESREERGNEIERTGDNGLVRESEDSIGAHPDREDTVVRVNHGDEEVQGNGGSSESVGNKTESDVGRSERGLGARADWDRLMAGELKKCLHKEHNQETSQDSGPANANIDMNTKTKKYSEMLHSKLILEHHLAFANECVQNSIYPLGLKAFVPCVAYKADDALKRKWKQILHNTSIELPALRRSPFNTLLEKTSGQKGNQPKKRLRKSSWK